ncbi:MAG: mechanosensitive ion channel family protein [Bacillota bacterium]|nr:mechanosensitive ion channel family protein [Bacillota bacterium]
MNLPLTNQIADLNLRAAAVQLPSFWQDTFLADRLLDNQIWNWLLALAIILAALALRKAISKLGELTGNKIFRKTGETGKVLAAALAPTIRLIVMITGLSLALQSGLLVFNERTSLFIGQVIETLKAVALCVGLAGIGTGLLGIRTEKARTDGKKSTVTIHAFYRRAIQIAAVVVAVFMILRVWGFDISGLLAGIGIGGLALSLAAQDTFSNLLAGLTIMTDHSFAIGDVISSPDVEGIVEDIGLRSSKIRSFTQALITVPNAKLSNNTVTNLSRIAKRRIRFSIGLEYGVTPDQIRSLTDKLKERMAQRDTLYPENTIICLEKFSASSIDVLFQCFVKSVDFMEYLKEQESILLEIMDVMAEEKLDFAFNAMTVHLNDLSQKRAVMENSLLPGNSLQPENNLQPGKAD